jgi:hypothetical protein
MRETEGSLRSLEIKMSFFPFPVDPIEELSGVVPSKRKTPGIGIAGSRRECLGSLKMKHLYALSPSARRGRFFEVAGSKVFHDQTNITV